MLRSKQNGPATLLDMTRSIEHDEAVVAMRQALREALAHQAALQAEWDTVLGILKTDIPTSSSAPLPSSEEKKAAAKRKAVLPDEFEEASEAVAHARARYDDARSQAKRDLLAARMPRLLDLLHAACQPLDEAAARVDALAEWYRDTCQLAQLSQTDTAPFQYPLSRFVLLHGTGQWNETKQLFIQQGLL